MTMDDNAQDSIVEAEVEEVAPPQVIEEDQATVLLSLEQMVKTNITSIEKLSTDLKQQKAMLEDVFINDSTYQEHAKTAKEAAQVKSRTKQEIMKRPSVFQIANKIKTMQADLKERQASLSDYLAEYQRMSGANEIEVENGEVLEIVATMRVVRRSTKQRD